MIIVITITLLFIVLRFTVTLFNFISNPKITRVNKPYTNLVSILIPVRNEQENILTLLESIRLQDYKSYEVIIYDDESDDNTYGLCAGYCALHPSFRIIKGQQLPANWLGKNYACYQLAKLAKGEYYLFLDASVTVHNRLFNSAVHRMQLYNLGLLSLFPEQELKTIGQQVTVPLVHYLLLNLLPLRLIQLTNTPVIAAASGQFMFFDAYAYEENQWHQQVKNELVEDARIMRLVKAANLKGEVLLGNGMVNAHTYKNYQEAIAGFSKNLPSIFNYNVLGLLIFILLLIGGPLIIITTLSINLIFFMAGLIMLTRVMVSLSSREPVWLNLLWHPVQMVNLAVIAFLAIQRQLTKTNVWKGRRV